MMTAYKKQGKRVIAAFLAICMALAFMPLNVKAAEPSDSIYEVSEGTPTDANADKITTETAVANTDKITTETVDANTDKTTETIDASTDKITTETEAASVDEATTETEAASAVKAAKKAAAINAVSEANQQLEGLASLKICTQYTPNSASVILRNETDTYETKNVFSTEVKEYNLGFINDNYTNLYFKVTPYTGYDTITIYYGDGQKKEIKNVKATSETAIFAPCVLAGKNTFTIEASGTGKATVTYTFHLDMIPTLTGLTFDTGEYEQFTDKTFSYNDFEYTLTIPEGADSVIFQAVPRKDNYTVTYNDASSSAVATQGVDKVLVKVSVGEGADKLENTYTVHFDKKQSTGFKVNTIPEDAVVMVYDKNGRPLKKTDGGYEGLFSTGDYSYTVTKTGYIGVSGDVPAAGGEINVTLDKASENQPQEVETQWKNFRDSDVNMGITDAETPINAEETELLWAKKLGSGWGNAPSVQIIVDDALIVMAGANLYKLDLKTGEILAQAAMVAAPNWGYTPPAYANGMIFCPLTGGVIQAFDAKTLDSLWIYKDGLGGQSLSPITYTDGYIYTGFWNSETRDANYVCISVTDEDTTRGNEDKLATWKHTQAGGFYWAGSVAVGDYVIVGTDDGTSGTSGNASLYSFKKETGEIVSRLVLEGMGDQRSSMAYDSTTGRVYFTTKGGYLCSAKVDASGNLLQLKSVNYNAQSTSTPIVYKGKVYFATGSGISSTGSSGNVVVADAETLEMYYAVGLKGYPQCSLLLSTAYEQATGYIYLYSSYNNTPGGISMIKVKPEATTADEAELVELYDAKGYEQYCITSIICDKDGTLYYKNDSANVMAVGVLAYVKVINKIVNLGDVNLESEAAIIKAEEAYEKLDEEEKAKITNYSTLVNARQIFETLRAEKNAGDMDALISAIGSVTLESEAAIIEAEEAYEKLTAAEKELVKAYDILQAARKEYDRLKEEEKNKPSVPTPPTAEEKNPEEDLPTTEEKSPTEEQPPITEEEKPVVDLPKAEDKVPSESEGSSNVKRPGGITIGGNLVKADNKSDNKQESKIEESVQKTDAAVSGANSESRATQFTNRAVDSLGKELKRIVQGEVEEITAEEMDTAIALYNEYSMLTEAEQAEVENYEDLQQVFEIIGTINHRDASSGIDIDGLQWYYKLNVYERALDNSVIDRLAQIPNKDMKELCSYNISITDLIKDESYDFADGITVRIPKPDMQGYTNAFVVCHADSGETAMKCNVIALSTVPVPSTSKGTEATIIKCDEVDGYLTFTAYENANYTVIGTNADYEQLINGATANSENGMIWILITIGALSMAGLVVVIIKRKKSEHE
ncbi:MAG: PQQ-binding-like beta-propeller repeat protein [Clostridium sp.]|nr:PQQ-binding-like beta-propeller repeat protein [Clostridium sp.]MCM1209473.1 PQQ-binding-like beta-propeller repeat protein [Ruminococcus sp.]